MVRLRMPDGSCVVSVFRRHRAITGNLRQTRCARTPVRTATPRAARTENHEDIRTEADETDPRHDHPIRVARSTSLGVTGEYPST